MSSSSGGCFPCLGSSKRNSVVPEEESGSVKESVKSVAEFYVPENAREFNVEPKDEGLDKDLEPMEEISQQNLETKYFKLIFFSNFVIFVSLTLRVEPKRRFA